MTNNDAYILGVDLGVGHPTNLGNTTQFQLGYSTFIYNPSHDYPWPFYGGVSVHKNLIKTSRYLLEAGLSYHYFSRMKVNGDLSQGISQPFYQANYFYSVMSSQALIEAIIRRPWDSCFSPYIIFGLGGAFNRTDDFSTNVPPFLTVTPSYTDETRSSFSYVIGAGMDYLLDAKLSIGIGYRFVDLGTAGPGSGQIRNIPVSDELKQSHLYVHTLALHFNYFI